MKIQRKSITEQVYDILQKGIEAGTILPGERIREDKLAAKLSVSKTPLRIALHQLKENGLVRIDPRLGIYLAVPTDAESANLIEMREVLEGLAARRAARKINARQIEKMRACFSGFDENDLASHRQEYAAADHKFHDLLLAASESAELTGTLKIINLRLHLNRLRMSYTRGHDLRPIHREHMAIIDALAAGDAVASENLVRAHVHNIPWQMVISDSDAPSAKPSAA